MKGKLKMKNNNVIVENLLTIDEKYVDDLDLVNSNLDDATGKCLIFFKKIKNTNYDFKYFDDDMSELLLEFQHASNSRLLNHLFKIGVLSSDLNNLPLLNDIDFQKFYK